MVERLQLAASASHQSSHFLFVWLPPLLFRQARQDGGPLSRLRPYSWLMDRRSFLGAAAAAPLALRSAVARGGWARGTPLALVTADLEASVVAVALETGKVVRRLTTRPGPRSIESVHGQMAVVAHTTGGVLSVIDGSSLRLRSVIEGFDEPRYTAIAADGRHAYVSDSGRGEIAVVDLLRGAVLGRLELGGPARHLTLSPSGRQLWVSLGSKAELVAVLDVRQHSRLRLVARLRPPFLAHDVGFAPDGEAIWLTSGDRATIAVYDRRRRRVRFRLRAGRPPQHVAFIGGHAYVTSGDDGSLHVHDVATGQLLGATAVPVGSYNVQQGFGLVLTPSLAQGTLCVVRRDGRVAQRVQVARSSHDACFVMRRRGFR